MIQKIFKILSIILLLGSILGKSLAQPAEGKGADNMLSNKKILMVIASEDYRDEELNLPKKKFEENGAKVTVASNKLGEARGMLGGKIKVDVLISSITSKDFDAIVVVGGIGSSKYLWKNKDLLKIVNDFFKEGKVIGAICLSPVVLARAGVLNGKKATVFKTPETIEELKNGKAEFVNKDVVVSDKIVTGNGPDAAQKFADEIIKLLK